MQSWLAHLLLASSDNAVKTLTYGIRKGKIVSGYFEPMGKARADELLATYLQAFVRGNSELLVFPFETCRALLVQLDKGLTLPDALSRLDQTWSDPQAITDAQDPYWSRLIESPSALNQNQIDQAQALLAPLTAAWVES